jgi:hypothetical protein
MADEHGSPESDAQLFELSREPVARIQCVNVRSVSAPIRNQSAAVGERRHYDRVASALHRKLMRRDSWHQGCRRIKHRACR